MDLSKTNKILLFSFVCVIVRLFLAILAYFISMEHQKFILPLSILFVSMAIGLIYNDLIKKPKGAFGSDRYWSGIVHGVFYILAAIALFYSPEITLGILLMDLLFGIITVAVHYS